MLICITGQIGSGKTSLLNKFKSLGFKTFEMDKYIHEIYKKNKIGYQLIKKNFGDSYVNEIEVDRKKLGQLVFNDNKKLNKLNSLTIPLIRQKILELKNINEHIFVELGIYLKYEKLFNDLFDHIILIKGKSEIETKKLQNLSWFNKKSDIFSPLEVHEEKGFIVLENNKDKKHIKNLANKTINILGIKTKNPSKILM